MVQLHGADCSWLSVSGGATILVMESANVGKRDKAPLIGEINGSWVRRLLVPV